MSPFTHRFKIWLMLEADAPLSIGSGREGLTTDRLVARNAAGLPYIPGTGLAGALRTALEQTNKKYDWGKIWGDKNRKFQEKNGVKVDITQGSRIIVNSAHLLAADRKSVLEGLPNTDLNTEYYRHFNALPLRDHVRINDRGVATDKGKFDEQVCFKGILFVGSLELIGMEKDQEAWKEICNQLASPFFRIGVGTRKGFGKIKVVHQYSKNYDLTITEQRRSYLDTENSLQVPLGKWQNITLKAPETEQYQLYELTLTPHDFFFFGAGYGDDEADDVYKTEQVIDWSTGAARISEQHILIPATSVKGALRHRLAFYYNKATGNFIDESATDANDHLEVKLAELKEIAAKISDAPADSEVWEQVIQELTHCSFEQREKGQRNENKTDVTAQNEAVRMLFGAAADQPSKDGKSGQRGNVIISDCYLGEAKQPEKEKVFDHVRIDRFTGGASDGALFQEKTVTDTGQFKIEILVARQILDDKNIKAAWHATLKDLIEGRLPLGGKTTKGHGFLRGTCNIDFKNNLS